MRNHERVDDTPRKSWYGNGTKDPEHSLESARWYYERLVELTDMPLFRLTAPRSSTGGWA